MGYNIAMRITSKMFRSLPGDLQQQIAQAILAQSDDGYRLIKIADYNPATDVVDLIATAVLSPDSVVAVRAKSKRGRRKDGGAK